MQEKQILGRVVSLDRGFPLVQTNEGERRAQHAIEFVKNSDIRATVGDMVVLSEEQGQENVFITEIKDRKSILARRELVESIHDGAGKVKEQVLAANFDFVMIVQSLGKRALDQDYLERQLVIANQSDTEVVIVLTKADLARHLEDDLEAARTVAGDSRIICRGLEDPIDDLVDCFAPDRICIMLGRSGVGKSTLINRLLGEDVLPTGSVRKKDDAGRHTTVARRMIELPCGGAAIDAPGVRAIGVHGATEGLAKTFEEITEASEECYYRDCTHTHEPDCAVIAAVEEGIILERRLESYRVLSAEVFD